MMVLPPVAPGPNPFTDWTARLFTADHTQYILVGKCRHDPGLDSIDLHRSSQVPEIPSPVWPVNLETYRNAPL